MNRTLTSLVSLGIGAAAYHLARNTNMTSNRSMKKMRKRVMKMF
ncbi:MULTISPECIES: YrzQ family protein [Metabacillus]|uniref:YrzQ family protein n=1 Tax=Metabacillus rhizolycopersici TaxID=2875709 RepID=A0ABS7UMR7_9BACI|nr:MULTISPECIES: YrzQ family protein [Metabacillus]MBZ5749342.1 YrzQ family protein [Metabacillus rhizolycopersici]MCM3650567.1 YrzQ family protein [Metabacillus litoralis]